MKRIVLAALLATACTRQVGLGESCETTKQCGRGSDCYRGVCTPLCANDDECDGELVCARHHCLMATGEPRAKGRTSKAEDRIPKTEDRTPTADDRIPNADGRTPTAENRTPNAENRTPNADGRKPTAENRTPTADDRGTPADAPRPGLRESDPSGADLGAELRAIRSELEGLRKEQQRLSEAVEALQKHR